MIIDFNLKEWQPNYLAFKDAGNVPPALTQLETTKDQHTALGRRYWNPLGECFIYVLCDCTLGRTPVVTTNPWSIVVAANTYCYVEDVGRGTAENTYVLYNLYGTSGTSTAFTNAYALYGFSSVKAASSTTATKCWGLVKLLPCNSVPATVTEAKSAKRS